MDEILERLRALAGQSRFPLELPTEDDLVIVEEAMLISIPHDFRVFLLKASDAICGALEPATAADPRSHTYLPDVAAKAWSIGMPREYVPICEYDSGFACIAQDGSVFFWKDDELEHEWDDFWYWCRDVWLASLDD